MTVNAHALARSPSNAGRMQIIGNRFGTDTGVIPGVNSAWGNYFSLLAVPLAVDWWVLGAYIRTLGVAVATVAIQSQGQIAVGAAGSEVPFASWAEAFGFLAPAVTSTYVTFSRTFLFPPIRIAAGVDVRAHATVDQATTVTRTHVALFGVPVGFYDRPNLRHHPEWFRRGRTGMPYSQAMADMMILPTPLTYTTVTLGRNAFGNWVTTFAAASQTQPLLVTGVKMATATVALLGKSVLLEIGIGEAAGAVGIEEVKFSAITNLGFATGVLELWRPIYIPPGSGLSLRGGSNIVAGQTVPVQLLTQPLK